jgi:hypothetical protein
MHLTPSGSNSLRATVVLGRERRVTMKQPSQGVEVFVSSQSHRNVVLLNFKHSPWSEFGPSMEAASITEHATWRRNS